MILILSLSNISITAVIDCSDYYLPVVPEDCNSESTCDSYEFLKNLATFDFGLFTTGNDLRRLFFTCYDIGKVIGCLIPWLADIYGRKNVINYNLMISIFSFTLLALSVNQTMLCISAFLIGIAELGILITTVVLCVETIDFKMRNLYIQVFWMIMPMGSIIFIVLLQLQVPWRYVLLICPLSILVQLLFMPYIQESPRYLLTNRCNVKAATKAINKISLRNGEGRFNYLIVSESSKNTGLRSIREMFTSKILTLQLTAGTLAWIIVVTGFYGSTFVMPDVFHNLFLPYILVHIVEIICNIILLFALILFGRKKSMASTFCLIGIIFIIVAPIEYVNIDRSIVTVVESILLFISRFSFYALFCLMYIFTAEMFPTNIRSAAFGSCNIVARIAESIGLSKLIFSHLAVSSLIIGAVTILCGASLVVFQETGGKELDEVTENNRNQPLLVGS